MYLLLQVRRVRWQPWWLPMTMEAVPVLAQTLCFLNPSASREPRTSAWRTLTTRTTSVNPTLTGKPYPKKTLQVWHEKRDANCGVPRRSIKRLMHRGNGWGWYPSIMPSRNCGSCCQPSLQTRNCPRSRYWDWQFVTSLTSLTCWTLQRLSKQWQCFRGFIPSEITYDEISYESKTIPSWLVLYYTIYNECFKLKTVYMQMTFLQSKSCSRTVLHNWKQC